MIAGRCDKECAGREVPVRNVDGLFHDMNVCRSGSTALNGTAFTLLLFLQLHKRQDQNDGPRIIPAGHCRGS